MNLNTAKILMNISPTLCASVRKKEINILLCLSIILISPMALSEDTEDMIPSSGMINREPFVSTSIPSTNLDKITSNISEISESLNDIIDDEIDKTVAKKVSIDDLMMEGEAVEQLSIDDSIDDDEIDILSASETPLEAQEMIPSSGMINREPFVSTEIQPSNLDKITRNISDVSESLNDIIGDEAGEVEDKKASIDDSIDEEELDIFSAAEPALEAQDMIPSSGMINRAPFISTKIQPSSLDKISTEISNIADSLDDIDDDYIEEAIIVEAETIEKPTQALIAEPEIVTPKKVHVAKPRIEKTIPLAIKETPADTPQKPTIAITQASIQTDHQINYLKTDHDGKVLPDNANTWSCIEDVKSGLIWEVKSDDGSIHDKNNSYTWFQPDATAPQGVADGGQCKGDSDCDTHAYVAFVNKQGYCSYSDWRLPTKDEMLSIVNFENSNATVTINKDYFPAALPSWYWTASSNENKPEYAWYVLFSNGVTLNSLKESSKHIRLVRTQITES